MPKIKRTLTKAQTATELAVFGTILIFVIGIIVQQAMSFHHLQNQNLRTLRLAMTLSYRHSSGFVGGAAGGGPAGNASRNFASVLLLEDRLSADAGKYGALSRAQAIGNAAGTHSRNYFLPTNANETWNLPRTDFFINGKHFPFTTAGFKTVCLTGAKSDCPTPYDVWLGDLDPNFWEANCVDDGSPPIEGCARLYTFISNNSKEARWCSPRNGGSCPNSWSLSERFDLDRDGSTDVPGGIQDDFAWQWILVSAFDIDTQTASNGGLTLLIGEGILLTGSEDVDPQNLSVDVDKDFYEESIVRNDPTGAIPDVYIIDPDTGVIRSVMVIDSNEGDLDMGGYDTNDYQVYLANPQNNPPPPGLMKDVAMFTRVSTGTYLEIRERGLYTTGQQFVRSVQRKDHVDVVQRMIKLSNDTGRFCNGTSRVTDPNIWWDASNPVEVCASECFSPANISRTCFDIDDLIIFVRSRVQDTFGHQWVTDTTSDDYINFVVPSP